MSGRELSREDRRRRVAAVVDAARRLAAPADPLGIEARRALPSATGLSPASIELSLSRHLETSVTLDDLDKLVTRAGSAQRVHVVLSANVFTAVVRAVAVGVAAAPSVVVRPSSREAVLAPLLLRALREQRADTTFELTSVLEPALGDQVHVYGRRETITAIKTSCPPGVSVWGHGPGFGVAVVGGSPADAPDRASRLSRDIVAFDQRGCLSPRLVLVEGTVNDAERFAYCLDGELEAREREVPRGALTDDERRDASIYRQTLAAVGELRGGEAFAVGLDLHPRALVVPPPGRHIHVARVTDFTEMAQLLASYRGAITCVGVDDVTARASQLAALAPGARILPLGEMQRPPLDGPVDLREML